MNRSNHFLFLLFYCLIYIGCSSSDNDAPNSSALEAIIVSENEIDIFDKIILDGSSSKGDIVSHSWKLIGLPEKISESLIVGFKEDVSDKTDVVLTFLPRISGIYTFEFTVKDKLDNISFVTKSIIVNSICNNDATTENLFTETFQLTDDWFVNLGEINDPDDSRCYDIVLEEGYFTLDNGYLEISSGTNRFYRYVTRDLSEIEISANDLIRFKIKIDGTFREPSYQFDYATHITKDSNIRITFLNYEIRIRNDTDLWYRRPNRYFGDFSDKELNILLKFIDNDPVIFVCADGMDITNEFEILPENSGDKKITFMVDRGNAFEGCVYDMKYKITKVEIDKIKL